MSQLFINVIGHNASGKTTLSRKLARDLPLNVVNGDDFRNFVHEHVRYFQGTPLSFPSPRYKTLNPLTILYRITLSTILLDAGQHVLFDGSGSNPEYRAKYLGVIKRDFPHVITVIIWTRVDEKELLKRLQKRDEERDAEWVRMYQEIKKDSFTPPSADEADVVIEYDQHNYKDVHDQLVKLLA